MRITSNMYYKNIFGDNNALLTKNLFDVNKQIASGLKIQYAKDDVITFSDTMKLDNEIVVLEQIKKSSESAYKMSNQADVVLNEFETTINRTRTLLIQAANGTNSNVSLDSISSELRSLEDHFINLANTSINGQYLFSGSAVDVKPITADGEYAGNDTSLNAFTGSRTKQQYNISGEDLFLGEKSHVRREITTNVSQTNLIGQYATLQSASDTDTGSITASSTIRDLMGDSDNVVDTVTLKHFFYIRGTRSNGDSFEQKISMRDDNTVDSLLSQIGTLYGNSPGLNVVNVSLNPNGQIVIEDKMKGSSKIDFHMVAATDLSGGAAADVNSIDALGVGENDFSKIMLATSTATNPNLHVKEFIKSSLNSASGVAGTNIIEGTVYDRTQFDVDGIKVSSSISQIVNETNAFATNSTKISEVATAGSLNGKIFNLEGVDINGVAYSAQINFLTAGSTFTVGASTYSIYDANTPRAAIDADDMTYRQLMDVVNMVVTDNLPASAPGTPTQYDMAINTAVLSGKTSLDYEGKIIFEENGTGNTLAQIALYDSNSGDFSNPASVMTFNTNNSLTVRDPKTNFFENLDDIITAVENYKLYPDSSSGDVRNVGIENAIAMLDDLQDHISRAHAQVGSQSNALNTSIERTELLKINTMSLRSSVIDTDLAEASLRLTQLNINYEAMLSTVGRVSQLSLVNYL
ncbi:MAG: flagellar biosynthesis protein FlgL [Sulfurimonas sp.]|nr:flagellar biosynthesis protein FlgL [Sulfurimonas sp.]